MRIMKPVRRGETLRDQSFRGQSVHGDVGIYQRSGICSSGWNKKSGERTEVSGVSDGGMSGRSDICNPYSLRRSTSNNGEVIIWLNISFWGGKDNGF